MPISADWRNDADYEYCDDLTPEQVAFEFLRRNPDYDADFRKESDEPPKASTSDPAPAAARWGLRFRCRSAIAQRQGAGHLAAQPEPPAGHVDQHAAGHVRRTHAAGGPASHHQSCF